MNFLDPYGFKIPEIPGWPGGEPTPSPLNLVTSCPCEFWFDGQDTTTVHLVGAGVSQWDDKSGNARHVAQAVAGQRPTYNPVTGRITLISANSTYLQSAGFVALAQPNTIFVLYKNLNTAVTSYIFTSSAVRCEFYTNAGSDFRLYAGAVLASAIINANDNIHHAEFNGLTSNYWLNGALIAGPANTGANALDQITLGANSILSSFIDAEIMEVFGYNCVLTLAERTALNAYLTTKWGL